MAVGPVETRHPVQAPGEDAVDLHVRRWQDWDDLGLDPDVEAVITRIQHIAWHVKQGYLEGERSVGLEPHDYDTLHALHIRETPGYATTGQLAETAGVSPATMTGRVDRLVRMGLVRRIPSEDDRRVVHVQVTDEGFDKWRRAMALRGETEDRIFAGIPKDRLRRLSDLLREVLLAAEAIDGSASI
ncbi:putative MarR-family regulator [Nostocoides japonicum T1-X7]|uniref:Putative MarR-family regulator n=2 Tax=Nostocoides japonicum TaxID=99481 RepID=A0A077M2J7_9MICO|nr:putative MarR-family regulator [Tetrasphaera japonica T1-X7]